MFCASPRPKICEKVLAGGMDWGTSNTPWGRGGGWTPPQGRVKGPPVPPSWSNLVYKFGDFQAYIYFSLSVWNILNCFLFACDQTTKDHIKCKQVNIFVIGLPSQVTENGLNGWEKMSKKNSHILKGIFFHGRDW